MFDLLIKTGTYPAINEDIVMENDRFRVFLEDFYSFASDKDKSDRSFYCLQPIVVRKCDEVTGAARTNAESAKI